LYIWLYVRAEKPKVQQRKTKRNIFKQFQKPHLNII
jgi:hypothetical protein